MSFRPEDQASLRFCEAPSLYFPPNSVQLADLLMQPVTLVERLHHIRVVGS